jgi:hypothetical protein
LPSSLKIFYGNKMANISGILDEAKSKNRICPKPIKWQKLYEMLPNKKRKGNGWEPPPPLILAAWHDTPEMQKMLRFVYKENGQKFSLP